MAMPQWDIRRLNKLKLRNPWFSSSQVDVDSQVLNSNSNDSFALFGYVPRRGNPTDDEAYVNKFIIAFKEKEPDAVAAAVTLITEALAHENFRISEGYSPQYLIAAPSSKAGLGSPAANTLISMITAQKTPPVQVKAKQLVLRSKYYFQRHTALDTPSHQEKKEIEDHLATIQIVTDIDAPEDDEYILRLLIIDDVYTRGNTFAACKELMLDADSRSSIGGLFIAKTWARNS